MDSCCTYETGSRCIYETGSINSFTAASGRLVKWALVTKKREQDLNDDDVNNAACHLAAP